LSFSSPVILVELFRIEKPRRKPPPIGRATRTRSKLCCPGMRSCKFDAELIGGLVQADQFGRMQGIAACNLRLYAGLNDANRQAARKSSVEFTQEIAHNAGD
jgi:hypothetical protein